jgi:hypothetical protein
MMNDAVTEAFPWLQRAFRLAQEAGDDPPKQWLEDIEAINNDWLGSRVFKTSGDGKRRPLASEVA